MPCLQRSVFSVVSLVLVSGDREETGHFFFLKNMCYPATVEKDPGPDRSFKISRDR